MNLNEKPIYFPGLNGLRFIAAFIVVICHVEQRKMDLGFANFFDQYFFQNAAGLGVTLFFVLSGFLITYLLLVEKKTYGKIGLKNFYIRRILRIWPLYYLIVILACFVFPHISWFDLPEMENYRDNFDFKLLMLILILPNVLHILHADVPYSGQTWSIGVEEQFYLLWPFLFQWIKKYILVLLFIIAIVVILGNGFLYVANNFFEEQDRPSSGAYKTLHFIGTYFTFFRIGSMAMGGIGACLLFFDHRWKKIFVNSFAEAAAWILLLILLVMKVRIPYVYNEVFSVIFFVIILNAGSGKSIFHFLLENRPMHYLGKISYGIYMYHAIAIVLVIKLFNKLGFSFSVTVTILLDFFVLAATILLAGLSYQFFEKPLIRRKIGFQRVKSGDE